MPRQKNTRPTNIYWLYDTRPETVAVFGPEGQPFYCGKTVQTIEKRLRSHRYAAPQDPLQKTYAKILECGDHLRTQLIETIPPENNWLVREQFFIAEIRRINPNATNVSAGGAGAAGAVRTPEQCAALSAARMGHKHSAATRAKIGLAQKGRKRPGSGKVRGPRPKKPRPLPQQLFGERCSIEVERAFRQRHGC